MPLKIVRNDITMMEVDAVVNTANEEPIYSSGVDGAIYKAAGEEELLKLRRAIGRMEEGEVAITEGLKLPAKYIIHAVSPLYIDGESGEEEKLRSCYKKSLKLARENKCKSIAFPLISAGGFGYPKEEAMRIAVDEINGFLLKNDMLIYIVVFGMHSTFVGKKIYPGLEEYIDANYVAEKFEEEYGVFGITRSVPVAKMCNVAPDISDESMDDVEPDIFQKCMDDVELDFSDENIDEDDFDECAMPIMECNGAFANIFDNYDEYVEEKDSAIKERMKHLSDTFTEYLLYLMEQKGLTSVDVYMKAMVDKRRFSKIKNTREYHPDKGTALRLCVGARLNLDETKDLLARAGYALSPCDKRDVIFSYFIECKVYDLVEIELTLEDYGLPGFVAS